MHALGEETGIEQVHHRVLGAPGILVHGQPVLDRRVEGSVTVAGAGVPQHIPGGVEEGVHGIGFAPGGTATSITVGVQKAGVGSQGRPLAGGDIFGVGGQQDRQFIFRHGNDAALVAIHHRYGSSPVSLPGDQPVPHPV